MIGFSDFGDLADAMGTLIFWSAVVLIVLGLTLGPRYIRSRERERLYDLMRTAYEKGQPVPPELIASLTAEPVEAPRLPESAGGGTPRDLRRAIVLIAVGIGLAGLGLCLGYGIGFADETGGWITGASIAGAGAIPGMIGLAYLLLFLMKRVGHKV